MDNLHMHLTLDRPATYQVRVPGRLAEAWCDWIGGMTVVVGNDSLGEPVTTLTGRLDQAALHGLLRRLYSLGIPVLSVTCLDCGTDLESEVG